MQGAPQRTVGYLAGDGARQRPRLAAPNTSSPAFNRISSFTTWINTVMRTG
ncbi:hypothetical protein ACIA6C_15915 [Streptomyces sp. NPDC051578]|uniref:hypothetical protein n=1 Tax=Streptomyces sp. NPDC051578 TaxID=3365662 RepID=UPI0037901498